MDDIQVGGDAIGHRQGRPHALEGGIAPGALDHAPIGSFEALAKFGQEHVLVVAAQVEEPLERVQDELLDAPHRQGAARSPAAAPPMPSATTTRYPSSSESCVLPPPGRLVLHTCIDLDSLEIRK